MSLRHPLATARGLGSAKQGLHHWWMQRLTAIALVPLIVWLMVSLVTLSNAGYADALAWVESPSVAVLLVLLIGALFYHAQLGLQVVLEDYVHCAWMQLAGQIAVRFVCVIAGVAGILAVLKVALGA